MRLSDEEWLRLTPYMMDLLIRRVQHAEFCQYHPSAKVAAILANVHRDADNYPEGFTEADFIPPNLLPNGWKKKQSSAFDRAGNVATTNVKKMTPEQQREFLTKMFVLPKRKKKHGKNTTVKART